MYPKALESFGVSATQAVAEPEEARTSPINTQSDRRRNKELERERRRKGTALAQAAALLALSKKDEAIFSRDHGGEDERSLWKIAKRWSRILVTRKAKVLV